MHTQISYYLHTFDRINIVVHIAYLHAKFFIISRQILSHFLCKRSDKHALALFGTLVYFGIKILYLSRNRLYLDYRIKQTCRTYDLLGCVHSMALFVFSRCSRNINDLIYHRGKLVKIHRSVIIRRRQTEAVIHKVFLSCKVAAVHTSYLRQCNVALVNEHKKIFRKMVHKSYRRATRRSSCKYP